MAHTWLAPPMEMDLKGWSVPTCSQELPCETQRGDREEGVTMESWLFRSKEQLPGCVSHRGVLGSDSQATKHVSLVAKGPDRDLLHPTLSQARHQGDVTQKDGGHPLPRTSQCDLTLPVCRVYGYFSAGGAAELRDRVRFITSSIFAA